MLLYSHVSQLATLDLSNCIMRYSLCTLNSEFPLDWETFECYLFTVDNLRGRHGEFTMSKESHMKVERSEISSAQNSPSLSLSVSLYSAFASRSLSLSLPPSYKFIIRNHATHEKPRQTDLSVSRSNALRTYFSHLTAWSDHERREEQVNKRTAER